MKLAGFTEREGRLVGSQTSRLIRLCRWLILRLTISLLCVFFVWQLAQTTFRTRSTSRKDYNDRRIANETLGFEKVVVVSTGSSWRRDGLLEAAYRTAIALEIPTQKQWTAREVDIFRQVKSHNENPRGRGLAQCWLGHLNVIREILVHGWSTSLIMEDDVDWDIAIKHQLSLIAPMIQEVTNASGSINQSPYGDGWDLLWLGHCGEATPDFGPVAARIDQSLPESPIYRLQDDYIYFPPQLRLVHGTNAPICTYAYALTYHGAMTIYQMAHGGRANVITGDLYRYCKKGLLRCVSVNPELFHHHKKAGELNSEIAIVEGWKNGARPPNVTFTANIKHSARCNSKTKMLVTCQDPKVEQDSEEKK